MNCGLIQNCIFENGIFVIVHKEGVLIKRIVEHNVENGTITVHSLNPIYPDKVISLAEVYQIFNVIEFLRPKRR